MKLSDSEVLFCDNHLLVMVKPCALPTQPAPEGGESLEEFAKEWVKEKYHKPKNVFLHAVHRLDKPVSGLVLFARTSKALSRLNEQQRNREIQRIYVAEVEGILPSKEGRLDHYLIHGNHRAMIAKSQKGEAKQARLTYRVLSFKEHTTMVAIELETGRYHQIRAQFGAIAHPVVGDSLYGAAEKEGEGIRLHSKTLALIHPVTKEELQFDSPAPFE